MRKFLFLLMAVILAIGQIQAQQKTITGKVTDEKGDVVPNASVIIKGSTVGTTTSSDGTFSISVPQNTTALVVTSVGLGTAQVTLTNSTNYNVVLSATAKNLDEVVVVAYGSQKRTNVTGSNQARHQEHLELQLISVFGARVLLTPVISLYGLLMGSLPRQAT